MGGAATRAALIKKIRTQDKQVLLLDAGDMFQGTPYFNFFDGELEYRLMSQMGYDAVTLGNHDFDKGIDGIIKQLPLATFDIINCNYDFSATALKDKVKPYRIFNKGGVNIGVIGVGIDLMGLVPNDLYAGIKYNDPISIASNLAHDLKTNKNCDFVICLSHLGYEYTNDKISDRILAQKSANIDLIIGGHTHTFLPKPVTLKNKENKEVIINQVGWAGLQLGKIELYFDSVKNLVNKGVAQNLYINVNAC
jgi:5'-nucleotidase